LNDDSYEGLQTNPNELTTGRRSDERDEIGVLPLDENENGIERQKLNKDRGFLEADKLNLARANEETTTDGVYDAYTPQSCNLVLGQKKEEEVTSILNKISEKLK